MRYLLVGLLLSSVLGACPKTPPVVQKTATPHKTPATSTAAYSPSFSLDGSVLRPATFTKEQLQALPAVELDVVYQTSRGEQKGHFKGVLLWDLVNQAGLRTQNKTDPLKQYLVITASDGYQVVVAMAELMPEFEGEQILVAYERDGQPFGDKDGMARLVMPGDKAAGRHVRNITRIEVRGL
jgi:DMSO/TMAO reductase YedYZ molybdopterin-dependent catalytic subunit